MTGKDKIADVSVKKPRPHRAAPFADMQELDYPGDFLQDRMASLDRRESFRCSLVSLFDQRPQTSDQAVHSFGHGVRLKGSVGDPDVAAIAHSES